MAAFLEKIKHAAEDKFWMVVKDVLLYYSFVSLLAKTLLVAGTVLYDGFKADNLRTVYKDVPSMPVYCSFIVVFLAFAYLFKDRARVWFLFALDTFFSLLLLTDLWYYRAYGNLLTLHLLQKHTHWKDFSANIIPIVNFKDVVFVADLILLLMVLLTCKNFYSKISRSFVFFILAVALPVSYVNYKHYKIDISTEGVKTYWLFKQQWAPPGTITGLSPIGFHLYDIYYYWDLCRPIQLTAQEKEQIDHWFLQKKEDLPDSKYKGMFKGKNLIFVQWESMENFVINRTIDGKEITPNMNRLLKNSLYFSNFHEETNAANSSDSDLLANTSVYPVRKGSTFFQHPYNTYNSLPKLMKNMGYSTLAVHPDRGAFWNWKEALYSIGFDKCMDYFNFTQDEIIGLGLSDESYLRQLEPVILKQKQPFYTFFVTLTSHGPFNLPAKYRELSLKPELDQNVLGGYFESVHYTDKQLGNFLLKLDKDGLLDHTVVVIYGDHCGVHKYYPEQIPKGGPEDDWWQDNGKRLPLIIYQKNLTGEEIKINGGQVDTFPTVAYLMGINEEEIANTAMGRNLLKTGKDFAVLADRKYVGKEVNPKEKENEVLGLEIADELIRSDYFKEKLNQ